MTGRVKAPAREGSEKNLTVKTSGLEDVFAEESSGDANEERMEGTCVERSESDIVGGCSPKRIKCGWNDRQALSADLHDGRPQG